MIQRLLLLAALAGCAPARPTAVNTIEVEGVVSVRGNEPFTALWLETDEGNHYVLVAEGESRVALGAQGRYRVSGTVFLAEWSGRAFAHLRVAAASRVGGG